MLVICNWKLFFSVKTTQFQSIISTFILQKLQNSLFSLTLLMTKQKWWNSSTRMWLSELFFLQHLSICRPYRFKDLQAKNFKIPNFYWNVILKNHFLYVDWYRFSGVFIKKVKCMGVVLNKIQKIKKGSHAHWGSQRPVLGICLHHTIACTYTKYEILHNLTSLNRKDQNFCFKI